MKQTMTSRVTAYLVWRRALGYKLRIEGQMLENFALYADRSRHQGPLTRSLALCWAALPKGADQLYLARRLEVVRVFAKHQAVIEPATEVPARHVFGPAHRRNAPHLFSAKQISQLLRRADGLSGRLRPATYQTLLGLLACSGLRISEALRLEIGDVDLPGGVLAIRKTKYQQTRFVPLHSTAVKALCHYETLRKKLYPDAQHFFVSEGGQRFAYTTVRTMFRKLTEGFASNSARPHVRLHDLRHTFACRVLLRWQRTKQGASGRVAVLSRYLGHQRVTDTYWYLTATPDLLREAAKQFAPQQP
ncbi:MAG TPA: tyrosine-type recombinase/integrase [Verrucomicrobiae bacterium]